MNLDDFRDHWEPHSPIPEPPEGLRERIMERIKRESIWLDDSPANLTTDTDNVRVVYTSAPPDKWAQFDAQFLKALGIAPFDS